MTGKSHGTRLVVLWIILAVVAGAGVFFYTVGAPIVLMAVQQAREASRRRQVENNLKQLGLALHNYHQSHSAQQGVTTKTYTNPIGETPIQMGDPFVLQHGDRYYLFGTNASNEGFKFLESTDLVHWTPKGWGTGKADENPIAATNLEIGVSGPGHSCITQSPDGREMFIVYHSHADPKKPSGERVVNIDWLQFDDDGKLKIKGPSRSPQPMPSGCQSGPTP